MPPEFLSGMSDQVVMGLEQAAGAIALCLAVVALCRRFAVRVGREALISISRGLVQMVFVGVVLALLLHGHSLISVGILLLMTVAAAVTAARRIRETKGALAICCLAIGSGKSRFITRSRTEHSPSVPRSKACSPTGQTTSRLLSSFTSTSRLATSRHRTRYIAAYLGCSLGTICSSEMGWFKIGRIGTYLRLPSPICARTQSAYTRNSRSASLIPSG